MNLEEVKPGSEVIIQGMESRDEALKRVEAMGLREGKRVEVLQKLGRNILIKLNNSRIVISRDLARRILVR